MNVRLALAALPLLLAACGDAPDVVTAPAPVVTTSTVAPAPATSPTAAVTPPAVVVQVPTQAPAPSPSPSPVDPHSHDLSDVALEDRGDGPGETEAFMVTGFWTARVDWTCTAPDTLYFAVKTPEQEVVGEYGHGDQAGFDTWGFHDRSGTFYIEVSTNCQWAVTVTDDPSW